MYYSTAVNLELQSLLHLSTSVVFQSWGLHVTPWRIDSLHMWGRELFQLSFGVLNFHLRPQGRSGHPVFWGQSKRASLVNYFGPLTLSNGVLSLKKCPKWGSLCIPQLGLQFGPQFLACLGVFRAFFLTSPYLPKVIGQWFWPSKSLQTGSYHQKSVLGEGPWVYLNLVSNLDPNFWPPKGF